MAYLDARIVDALRRGYDCQRRNSPGRLILREFSLTSRCGAKKFNSISEASELFTVVVDTFSDCVGVIRFSRRRNWKIRILEIKLSVQHCLRVTSVRDNEFIHCYCSGPTNASMKT